LHLPENLTGYNVPTTARGTFTPVENKKVTNPFSISGALEAQLSRSASLHLTYGDDRSVTATRNKHIEKQAFDKVTVAVDTLRRSLQVFQRWRGRIQARPA